MEQWQSFVGPNAAYVMELYDQYRENPGSVDEAIRRFFDEYGAPPQPGTDPQADGGHPVEKTVSGARLARSLREFGHLAAQTAPLGTPSRGDPSLDPKSHGLTDEDLRQLPGTIAFPGDLGARMSLHDALGRLRQIYTGPLGYDWSHVHEFTEREWLKAAVESGTYRKPLPTEERGALLRRLTEVEGFEQHLHQTFLGQKRFSVEGTDILIPMLDSLVKDAAESGTREIMIGMAHRGRLNVLAHILEKPLAAIFSEFLHTSLTAPPTGDWTGDVKYHMGAKKSLRLRSGEELHLTLANNPSHLEFVNPVVQGLTRAAQEDRGHRGPPTQDTSKALSITIHGDAAFPGEGVVAETLNLSRLHGYRTGGTIHLIVNNLLGFTTEPDEDRSTLYASDLAKGFEIPVIHVNADDPEACLTAVRIGFAYRHRFGKDFLVDLIGYRRWGHNEGDEPAFTQPLLYREIDAHPTVRAIYADRLVQEGALAAGTAERFQTEVQSTLKAAQAEAQAMAKKPDETVSEESFPLRPTAVSESRLRDLNEALLARPQGFTANEKLERLLNRRRTAMDKDGAIEWAHGEALALASLLEDGTPVRLAGQDAARGTFSQRHLALHDATTGGRLVVLENVPSAKASVTVLNSPLSEVAALGFEYGYSIQAPESMVLWEAQFGDFANAAQVIIDQFISASRAKWRETSSLVLLLPHGYEGQGPEHSSARLERYLQLAAEDNLRVANPTTSAQYFHLLRLQAALLKEKPRPLIVMTPKSLLRHPLAGSSLRDLTDGSFQPALLETLGEGSLQKAERLVVTTGKVATDLVTAAQKGKDSLKVAHMRLEALYPFPKAEVMAALDQMQGIRDVIWLQEEPKNMGAWTYVRPRLQALLPKDLSLTYVGRPDKAATAEGSPDVHAALQSKIVQEALDLRSQVEVHARGGS